MTGVPPGHAAQIYVIANVLIGFGYLAIPALVLPYLNLSRRTVLAGVVFFVGCFGSHADMTWDILAHAGAHPGVGWFATAWHVLQAVGTWAFIMWFRWDLKRAHALVDLVRGDVGGRPPAGDE